MGIEPKLRFVVRHPDGREDSYPLDYGRYDIGSGETCRIRIKSEEVDRVHALLILDEEGASLVNLDLHHPDALLLEGEPIRECTRIETNDSIVLGPVKMKLLDVQTVSADTAKSPDGTIRIHDKLTADVQEGVTGYRRFQQRMSPYISPEEAEQAEAALRKAKRALGFTTLGWLVLYAAAWLITPSKFWHIWLDDSLISLGIFTALILVSRFHIPFAGRLLLPAVFVLLLGPLTEPPRGGWIHDEWMREVFLIAAGVYGTACLFDFGAATLPNRTHPALRRLSMLLFGLIWLGMMVCLPLYWPLSGGQAFNPAHHFVLFATLCFCCFWGWWPGRWIEHSNPTYSTDVWEVLRYSMVRWGRWMRGLTLALICGFFPFFLFFNLLGFNERIKLPENSDALRTVTTNTTAVEKTYQTNLWFWGIQGRLVTTHDILETNSSLYALAPSQHLESILSKLKAAPEHHKIESLLSSNVDDMVWVTNYGTFVLLQNALTKHRVTNSDPFVKYKPSPPEPHYLSTLRRSESKPKTNEWDFLLLMTNKTRPTWDSMDGRTLCVVHRTTFVRIFEDRLETYTQMQYFSYFYLVLAVGGIIFLWRRGGDSGLAFWIGFWLIAWAASGFRWWADNVAGPAAQYKVWSWALESHLGSLAFAALQICQALTWLMQQSELVNVPFCAILALLCWPAGRREAGKNWGRLASQVGTIVLITIVTAALYFYLYTLLRNYDQTSRVPHDLWEAVRESLKRDRFCQYLATSVSWFFLAGLGYLLRPRDRSRQSSDFRNFRALDLWPWVVAYLGFSVMRLCTPWLPLGRYQYLSWVAFAVASLSLSYAVLSLLKRNFMGIARTAELSSLVVLFVIAFSHEFLKDNVKATLHDTSFFSDRGTDLLTILVIVALFPWAFKWIEFCVGRVVNPRLRRVEGAVEHTLEAIDDAQSESERQALISAVFDRLEVRNYAFYSRGQDGTFEIRVSRMEAAPVARFALSKHLRRFLGRRRRFVDLLERVPLELRFYFHQFELYRIEQMTGCRYLLPICFGKSVRGLLFLPHGKPEADLCKDEIAENIGVLGAAAIKA